MADHPPPPTSSTSQNQTKPSSSFFTSPRFFNGFLKTELTSPNSILDTKLFSPFAYDRNHYTFPNNSSGTKQGLALADSLYDEMSHPENSQPLFGRKLNIQIPQFPPCFFHQTDFGTKTPKPQLVLDSSSSTHPSEIVDSQMEISEDYTCVTCHGSNPKTTHIYDNYVVEGSPGVSGSSRSKRKSFFSSKKSGLKMESFLSFCYNCKKRLEQGKDIYMYGGEKAFCSSECRQQEMLSDGMESL